MAESKVSSDSGKKKDGVTTLIAMDGSEYSSYALTFYVQCLHKPGNRTILAHTVEHKGLTKPLTGDISEVIADMAKDAKKEEAKAGEFVEDLTKRLKELGIDGSIERVSGDPGPAIVKLANEKNADYIVVGCRGTGTTRKTFTGSVTDYVTHHSHVPILIARNQEHLEKLHHHAKKHMKVHKKHNEHAAEKHDEHATKKHDEHATKKHDEHATKKHDEHATKKHDGHATKKHDEHATKKHDEHATKKHDEHATHPKDHKTTSTKKH